MAGQGTTHGGDFRYPYEYTTIVDLIQEHLGDEADQFVAFMMDRDRALEDYLSSARNRFPWLVVADDGTGDFVSIKRAVESIDAGERAVIAVKPGTYTDTARIAPALNSNITIVGTFGHVELPQETTEQNMPAGQLWTVPGVTPPASATAANTYLTLIGIHMECGANQVIADQTPLNEDCFRLAVQNGAVTSSLDMYRVMSQTGGLGFAFSDAYITANLAPTGTGSGATYVPLTMADITASRSALTRFGVSLPTKNLANPSWDYGIVGPARIITPATEPSVWNVSLQECSIGGTGTVTFAAPGGIVRIDNCHFENHNGWVFEQPQVLEVSNCFLHGMAALKVDQSTAGGFGHTGTLLTNNVGVNCEVTVEGTEEHNKRITGIYKSLILLDTLGVSNRSGAIADVVIQDTLEIGSACHVNVSFQGGSGESPYTIDVHGEENTVFHTLGTGTLNVNYLAADPVAQERANYIGKYPPAGPAGGDLGGFYPNPTVTGITGLSIFNAKGDLLVATADNTPARLAVGANDTVLTADSTQTTGIKWATPAPSTPYFVPSGSTFTVPTNIQVLYATTIDVEGILDVIGLLIEVD